MLDSTQLQDLHDDIVANTHHGEDPADLSRDANQRIADIYNAQASPDYYVWKNQSTLEESGMAIDLGEINSLTTAESNRMSLAFEIRPNGFVPSKQSDRALFGDVFSSTSGAITRPALLSAWQRLATLAEKLFAIGGGSEASDLQTDGSVTGDPAVLGFEGEITQAEVGNARRLS